MTLCEDHIELLSAQDNPDGFLRRIITGDETWISTFENETKQSSTAWVKKNALHPKKPLTTAGVKKSMMTVFF